MALLFRNWIVTNSSWNHEHFAFIQLDCSAFHFDAEVTFEDQEEFVFVLVAMPG